MPRTLIDSMTMTYKPLFPRPVNVVLCKDVTFFYFVVFLQHAVGKAAAAGTKNSEKFSQFTVMRLLRRRPFFFGPL